jgi:hypothetical protein
MTFLKDKLLIFIFLVALLQSYILVTRGDWKTNIEQREVSPDDKNRFKLTDDLSVESEHTISKEGRIVGTHTYFVTDKCFTIDSLSISIAEVYDDKEIQCNRANTRIADLDQLEFDSQGRIKEETLLKSVKITVCPGQRIEISNWFEYPHKDASNFRVNYFILTDDKKTTAGHADLIAKTSFQINGRNHYDFIILLYPVLWGLLGILILFKVIRVVQKK